MANFESNYTDLFANKDESIDLDSLINEAQESEKAAKEMRTEEDAKIAEKIIATEGEKNNISPLEKLKQHKETQQAGMVLSNQELEDGKEKAVKGDVFLSDERMESFDGYQSELDDLLKKRSYIEVVTNPSNQREFANLMMEIDSIRIGMDGKPYYDLKDGNGNPIRPKYTRIKDDSEIREVEAPETSEEEGKSIDDDLIPEKRDLSDGEKEIIKVIIDKTGYGADFAFTEEEKKKIKEAEVIELNEVKRIDINSIRSKVSSRSFHDLTTKFDYSSSRSSIFFPASGFKAQMKGLTYGEFADIALSMENIDEEKYRKQLSIIYNKMTNISIGDFDSFDEFLKHFCYIDVNLAIYALYVATEDDQQEIQLKCGNMKCGKNFDWAYNTRSLIRLDRCSKKFIEKMNELITADASSFEKIHQDSVVLNSHFIELPKSKFVVEIGLASAYEYLHNIVPILNENKFKEIFGENYNEMHLNISVLLTTIRSIYVPDDGSYVKCDSYRDIIDAIYNISPEEIAILNTYSMKFMQAYEMSFGFDNVVCKHCGTKTKFIPVQPSELIFTTYQRLANTELELKTLQDF